MSAHRILQILRFVAHQKEPATVKGISEHLHVPRATVYRLIMMLEKESVLQRTADNKHIDLSENFLRSMITGACKKQVVTGFEDALVSTANAWGATAFVGRLTAATVEIVHAVAPLDKTYSHVHPGISVRPAHACSSARAILAFMPEDRASEVLGRDFDAITDRTITGREALFKELRLTRERGFAVCDEEVDIGITSVAAPVTLGKVGTVYSLGIVAASKRMHELGIAAVGESLGERAAHAAISLCQNMSVKQA